MTMPPPKDLDLPPQVVFSTERLRVRHWAASDLASVIDVYGDPAVVRWVDDGQPITAAEAVAWIDKTRLNYETYGYGMFVLEDRGTRAFIGFGGLVHPGGQPEAEVKYALLPRYWGQGLATEFVKGLLDHAACAYGLTTCIATVDPSNTASQNVLRKAQFHYAGARTDDDGTAIDLFTFGEPLE